MLQTRYNDLKSQFQIRFQIRSVNYKTPRFSLSDFVIFIFLLFIPLIIAFKLYDVKIFFNYIVILFDFQYYFFKIMRCSIDIFRSLYVIVYNINMQISKKKFKYLILKTNNKSKKIKSNMFLRFFFCYYIQLSLIFYHVIFYIFQKNLLYVIASIFSYGIRNNYSF